MKNKCFVIQPFDSGGFDRRYEDVVAPAVEAADLSPYRVDRDPSVVVPIEEVEKGIATSSAVVADISLDNPNIWYEVGYAQAAEVPLVLICSSERETFPFDIQHRSIIVYHKESPSDFEQLKNQITMRLDALVSSREKRIADDIRKSRALELSSLVMRTPYYDISLVEEILLEVKDYGDVDVDSIGNRRLLTPATITNIVDRMIRENILERIGGKLKVTSLGDEMASLLSLYLRPKGIE